ncbi:hypothetical protein IFM89_003761 [Coptis chinensis]|uniref:protein-serine/threonine phosphatase n=1 Tax=Coptis chinensis TaxID=261450 RepID=A0A835I7M8_9MAGN|nr:hypothetical protein IFM89_003761 [Coptis chinensis]
MGCWYSKHCIEGISSSPGDSRIKESKSGRAPLGSVFSPVSSDDGEGENGDQFNQLNRNRDSEVGITRLSRVSSQFLPPDGSRTVKLPSGRYELKYSYLSQRGYYPDALDKANQDSFCIHTPFGTNPDDHFFGVFDGHGEYGAQCSQFVKKKLCENLLRNSHFQIDAIEACHAAFLATNSQLHSDYVDDSMSGTTAITILVRGRTLYIANAGDSRAIIAERRGKDLVSVDLSIDQTPFRADELERVKQCGARVLTLDQIEGLKNPDVQCWGTEESDDGDPPRLWVQNGMYPGTAFTRSLGDSVAESIGVVATPEIVVLELNPNNPFFVIASDGVFEFLSSQAVVDMVAKFKDPRDACAAIVAESYRLWLQYETRTDDITVIVVHINGLADNGVIQSTTTDISVRHLPQIVEVKGSESPSTIRWNARNNRARHDLSRARLRAIECSLENGQVWVPPSPSHRKTWEEEAHIERALHDHFLFRKLTDSQCNVLLDCMQRVEVQPGDVVVEKGGEGDCFYVVGSGEFEVLATQEEKNEEVPRVLQLYTAEKLSSFGELALMYNKPLQASVRAVTNGTLWALRREDFRGILMSEFSNLSSLKLLRSVELLSRLTILQLSHIAESLSEISFLHGQTIIDKNEPLSALYIIQKGKVRITYDVDLMTNVNISSLLPNTSIQEDLTQSKKEVVLEKTEGSYFGEWALLGEHVASLSAVAVGDVVCVLVTKEKFDSVVGPLTKIPLGDDKLKDSTLNYPKESAERTDASNLAKVQLSDLEWRTCMYSTDCSDTGLVLSRGSENMLSLKRFSKQKIKQLGKEAQVLKEKDLMKSLIPSAFIPQIICTCADQTHVGILLNTCLACPFVSILRTPLDESSARFCAASVVIALEDLHKNGVLYRGICPDVIMFDRAGYVQLVDFRFGKKLSGERTFTICGMTDSLAPEIIQGKGHTYAADCGMCLLKEENWWKLSVNSLTDCGADSSQRYARSLWALGVLIYFTLQAEMPFGSWRESELDTFAKIARGQLHFPQTFSPEVVDLLSKLLEVDESARLGSQGADSIKSHRWFEDVVWEDITNGTYPVPHEITSRIAQYVVNHTEDCSIPPLTLPRETGQLDTPEWLEDW